MEHERIALLQGLRLSVTMMMELAEREKEYTGKNHDCIQENLISP